MTTPVVLALALQLAVVLALVVTWRNRRGQHRMTRESRARSRIQLRQGPRR